MTNGNSACKTSEVFCKPTNLRDDVLNKNKHLRMTCSNRHHDVQRTCNQTKSIFIKDIA